MSLNQYSDSGFVFYEDKSNPRTMEGPRHYHNVIELYFMERGSCNYFVDDKVYRVSEGDLVLIPCGVLHKTRYGAGERARRLIHCSADLIPDGIMDRLPRHYHNPTVSPRIRELFEEIRREYNTPDAYSPRALPMLVGLLFLTLARNAEGCTAPQPRTLYTERAICYIKEHYAAPLSLSSLSEQLEVSPEHLSRLFKKETGFGFCEYLTTVRLQKAEQLLKAEPGLRVAEVAFACGFNDSNYFSYKFKQIYGFSPGELRKKQ